MTVKLDQVDRSPTCARLEDQIEIGSIEPGSGRRMPTVRCCCALAQDSHGDVGIRLVGVKPLTVTAVPRIPWRVFSRQAGGREPERR